MWITLLVWNTFTWALMGFDKYQAQGGRYRVAEQTLLMSGLCLGAPGILLGMYTFRHKIRHRRFVWGMPVCLLLNLLVGLLLVEWAA